MANGDFNTKVAWEWFWRFLSVIVVPWAYFQTTMVRDQRDELASLNTRVAVMEQNRFTSNDGLDVWKAIAEKADKEDNPPQWLLDRVNHLEEQVDALEK